MPSLRRALAPILVAVLLGAAPARACPVCIALPQDTLADRLLAAETVVLARPPADAPFSYVPVRRLAGAGHDDLPAIPFLADSTTRRRLAQDTDAGTLLAHTPGDGWHLLSYGDAAMVSLARAILSEGRRWRGEDDPRRFAFFADRLGDAHAATHRLALAEIGRAPYALIRGIEPATAFETLTRLLADRNEIPYRQVRILLLGLHDDPRAAAAVRDAIDDAAQHGTATDLGAWVVAYVERDGAAAVADVAARLLAAAPAKVREAAIDGLAVQGRGGRPALREVIVRALLDAAERDSRAAAAAAGPLADWGAWGAVEAAARHLRGPLGQPQRFALSVYLGRARLARQSRAGSAISSTTDARHETRGFATPPPVH